MLTSSICCCSFLSGTKITANRDTVAGDACCKLSVSNMKFTDVGIDLAPLNKASNGSMLIGNLILSPDDKLSNLLSSSDEFKASIQFGSTSPSNTIIGHTAGFLELSKCTDYLAALVRAPSFHSFVC